MERGRNIALDRSTKSIILEIQSVIALNNLDHALSSNRVSDSLIEVIGICQQRVASRLVSDLELIGAQLYSNDEALKQGLFEVVGTNSAFWDKYYVRLEDATSEQCSGQIGSLEPRCVGIVARRRYPWFYIIPDVVFFTTGGDRASYELYLQSLQRYLTGQLFRLAGYRTEPREEFCKALRLVQGSSPSPYSEHLSLLIMSDQFARDEDETEILH